MMYTLVPHKGIDSIMLYDKYDDILTLLKENNVKYTIEIQDNSECTVKYNWHIITVNDSLKLFFSEGNYKLFKISVVNNSNVLLPNGIYVGMKTEEALKMDSYLRFNDWDEIYESGDDYYLEDSLELGKIVSINIYVKELNNEDFDLCNW